MTTAAPETCFPFEDGFPRWVSREFPFLISLGPPNGSSADPVEQDSSRERASIVNPMDTRRPTRQLLVSVSVGMARDRPGQRNPIEDPLLFASRP